MKTISSTGIARNIKLIAWARVIRYTGWGFGESLIPIIFLSLSHSFAGAGLFRAVLSFTAIFFLPLAGALADRVSARSLVIVGLLIYPFIGLGYYLAGAFGLAIAVVATRLLNGISWPLESIGVDTYYRRMAGEGSLMRSFGYIDTLAELGWILAACAGIFLIKLFPAHVLLLLVIPTSLIAILLVLRADPDPTPVKDKFILREHVPHLHRHVMHSYAGILKEFHTWDYSLQLVAFLTFFSSLVAAFIGFFVPIVAYTEGADFTTVILLAIGFAIPNLFGYPLGLFADKQNPYRMVGWGLFFIAVGAFLLALVSDFGVRFGVSLALGVILELFVIIEKSLITDIGASDFFGRRGSVFTTIAEMGDLSAPLLLGIVIDMIGFSDVAGGISVLALILALSFWFFGARRRLRVHTSPEATIEIDGVR